MGWGMSAGVDMPIGSMITLHATGSYGDGDSAVTGAPSGGASINAALTDITTLEAYGFGVGASLRLSEASSVNAAYSYVHQEDDAILQVVFPTSAQSYEKIHVNYMWQPVSKLRMGVEGIYSKQKLYNGSSDDNIRAQFGTWFFF